MPKCTKMLHFSTHKNWKIFWGGGSPRPSPGGETPPYAPPLRAPLRLDLGYARAAVTVTWVADVVMVHEFLYSTAVVIILLRTVLCWSTSFCYSIIIKCDSQSTGTCAFSCLLTIVFHCGGLALPISWFSKILHIHVSANRPVESHSGAWGNILAGPLWGEFF